MATGEGKLTIGNVEVIQIPTSSKDVMVRGLLLEDGVAFRVFQMVVRPSAEYYTKALVKDELKRNMAGVDSIRGRKIDWCGQDALLPDKQEMEPLDPK